MQTDLITTTNLQNGLLNNFLTVNSFTEQKTYEECKPHAHVSSVSYWDFHFSSFH